MSSTPGLRRPIFIHGKNLVGGAEYLVARRAECARRLGVDPVIITVPGPMDEQYRRGGRVIHVEPRILGRPAFMPSLAHAVADEIVGLLGKTPAHIEATGVIDTYFASLIAERIPGSDYSLLIMRERTALHRGPPAAADVVRSPASFLKALLGFKDNGVLAQLSATRRVITVSKSYADEAARLIGLPALDAVTEPVILPEPLAVAASPAAPKYLLSVSRLDGKMKTYVCGLAAAFARLRKDYPALRLKVVGDGPGMPALREKVKEAGVEEAVDFLGTLPPPELAPLYAGATVFVGMGTTACEAAMYGVPVVLAHAYQPHGLSPGYFGQPGVEGFGEHFPGQVRTPFFDLIRPLLADPDFAREVSERGRSRAIEDHSPAAAMARMRELLSRPPVPPVRHPWPIPRWPRLVANMVARVGSNRPLARWA
jgi:glycosyltransferase involved in cell wall biosynthesis